MNTKINHWNPISMVIKIVVKNRDQLKDNFQKPYWLRKNKREIIFTSTNYRYCYLKNNIEKSRTNTIYSVMAKIIRYLSVCVQIDYLLPFVVNMKFYTKKPKMKGIVLINSAWIIDFSYNAWTYYQIANDDVSSGWQINIRWNHNF